MTILVRLTKHSSNGLGIVVSPKLQNCGLIIAELIKGSDAVKTGLLRPGDTILKVNNKELENLPYEQCLRCLQELPVEQEVEILVKVPNGYTTRLVTTFSDDGVARTTRITNLIPSSSDSPVVQRRRESVSDESLRRLKTSLVEGRIECSLGDGGGQRNGNELLKAVVPEIRQNGDSSKAMLDSPERPATLTAK